MMNFLSIEPGNLNPYIATQLHALVTISLFVFLSATQAFLVIYTYGVGF
jgi:hypothetical protein